VNARRPRPSRHAIPTIQFGFELLELLFVVFTFTA
jgi:hypothetical protein